MTDRPQLVNLNDRIELYVRNELRAYVEDDTLYTIGKDGYAVRIGTIEHRAEIIAKWENSCGD